MLIFFIHGVATRNIKYADPLKTAIKQRLLAQNQTPPTFYSCFWGNALSDVEKMWNWVDQDLRSLQQEDPKIDINDWFRYRGIREGFLSEFIGDMFTYLHPRRGAEIRRTIAQQLIQFIKDNPQETDLHIISHSLGTVILWDVLFSERFGQGDPAFFIRGLIRNLSNEPKSVQVYLKSITTMGSPILFFNTMLGTNPDNAKEFAKRNSDQGLKWLNIIQASDLIAYPLQSMFGLEAIDALQVQDEYIKTDDIASTVGAVTGIPIDAGSSHSKYWTCERTVDSIINYFQNREPEIVEKTNLKAVVNLLRDVPEIKIDKLRLHVKEKPVEEIRFSDKSGRISYVVNIAGVHHIYVFDSAECCVFSGYVDWGKAKSLKDTIEYIREVWC